MSFDLPKHPSAAGVMESRQVNGPQVPKIVHKAHLEGTFRRSLEYMATIGPAPPRVTPTLVTLSIAFRTLDSKGAPAKIFHGFAARGNG